MKIAHFSDWHGNFLPFKNNIPDADLYICTGDMLRNFCKTKTERAIFRNDGVYPGFDKNIEKEKQLEWVVNFVYDGGFHHYFGDKPIVCVRGNHDFIDLDYLFTHCNLIHEFIDNEVIEFGGFKITGHRGIPYIYGTWNDEYHRADLKDKMRAMDLSCDIFLTHYAPAGALDLNFGLEGMLSNFMKVEHNMLHCFGHIHECGGLTENESNMVFSNAAQSMNEIEFNK